MVWSVIGFYLVRIAFKPFQYPFHVFRPWLIQPLFATLFFLGPVLNIFRVDMINQQLVFIGQYYPFELEYLMWLPLGFYGGVLLVGVITAVFGRLFCGWACPHNILTEVTKVFRGLLGIEALPNFFKRLQNKYPALQATYAKVVSVIAGILFCYGMTFLLFAYVVPLDWLLTQYQQGARMSLIMGQVLFTLIGVFLMYSGHLFCKTCCPYGLAQSISAYNAGKWRPMEIKFSGDKGSDCKTCTGCQQVCPVEIDPRDFAKGTVAVGQFLGCWNCGECIDACKQVHDYKSQPSLLSFSKPFGKSVKSKTAKASVRPFIQS